MEVPYYPLLLIHDDGQSPRLTAETLIRKCHEGVWYVWQLIKRADRSGLDPLAMLVQDTHVNAFDILTLGEIVPDMKDFKGNPVWIVDALQSTEADRIMWKGGYLIPNGKTSADQYPPVNYFPDAP